MHPQQIKALLETLAEDEVRNCSMIEFVRRNPVDAIEREGAAILVRGRSDHTWLYVSSPDPEELERLAAKLTDDDDHFAAIEEWMFPMLARGRETAWSLPMVRFVLPDSVVLPS